jgi:hypothetical protein
MVEAVGGLPRDANLDIRLKRRKGRHIGQNAWMATRFKAHRPARDQ